MTNIKPDISEYNITDENSLNIFNLAKEHNSFLYGGLLSYKNFNLINGEIGSGKTTLINSIVYYLLKDSINFLGGITTIDVHEKIKKKNILYITSNKRNLQYFNDLEFETSTNNIKFMIFESSHVSSTEAIIQDIVKLKDNSAPFNFVIIDDIDVLINGIFSQGSYYLNLYLNILKKHFDLATFIFSRTIQKPNNDDINKYIEQVKVNDTLLLKFFDINIHLIQVQTQESYLIENEKIDYLEQVTNKLSGEINKKEIQEKYLKELVDEVDRLYLVPFQAEKCHSEFLNKLKQLNEILKTTEEQKALDDLTEMIEVLYFDIYAKWRELKLIRLLNFNKFQKDIDSKTLTLFNLQMKLNAWGNLKDNDIKVEVDKQRIKEIEKNEKWEKLTKNQKQRTTLLEKYINNYRQKNRELPTIKILTEIFKPKQSERTIRRYIEYSLNYTIKNGVIKEVDCI